MKEADVERRLDRLKDFGFDHIKLKVPGRSHLPDRLIFMPRFAPGPPMFLEVKLNDEPRPAQIACMEDLENRGCKVLPVCRDYGEIDALINKLISDIYSERQALIFLKDNLNG